MKRPIFAIICALSFTAAAAAENSAPTRSVRLAVVDTSGSMGGQEGQSESRLDVVRRELEKLAVQLPPSSSDPFAIITFNSAASKPQVFADLPSFRVAVQQLRPSGGTNIASGLAEAQVELQRHLRAGDVVVLLYTDGEDSDQTAILQQEAKLDAVFAQRQKVGLTQSVVFCKRWGNSNEALLNAIRQHGRATVIDAGQLQLSPVTFDPRVQPLNVAWKLDSDEVEITFKAELAMSGTPGPLRPGPLVFHCSNAGVRPDPHFPVQPGAAATQRHLRLPVSSQEKAAGGLTLGFDIDAPQAARTDAGVLLPVLTTRRLTVPVSLPKRTLRNKIEAQLKLSGSPTWHDPLKLVAHFPVMLTLEITPVNKTTLDPASRFRVAAQSGNRIVQGDERFKIPGTGTYNIPFTVEAVPEKPEATLATMRFNLQLLLTPIEVPPDLVYDPPELRITFPNISPPPPVQTMIVVAVDSVSTPEWTNLATSQARFTADLLCDFRGPVPANARLKPVSSPAAADLRVAHELLQPGSQRVRLTVTTSLLPAPQTTTIPVEIAPPTPTVAVTFCNPPTIRLSVVGPPPARLLALDGHRLVRVLTVSVPDNATQASVTIHPILYGAPAGVNTGSLAAQFRPDGNAFHLQDKATLPLFATQSIPLHLQRPAVLPFFEDTVISGHANLEPNQASPVDGTKYELRVIFQAPFKRLMFMLAVSLSVVLAFATLLRMFLRLRQTER